MTNFPCSFSLNAHSHNGHNCSNGKGCPLLFRWTCSSATQVHSPTTSAPSGGDFACACYSSGQPSGPLARRNRSLAHSVAVSTIFADATSGCDLGGALAVHGPAATVAAGNSPFFLESMFIDLGTCNGTRPNSPVGAKPATTPQRGGQLGR